VGNVVLGRVVGETSHTGVIFTAVRPPRVGEYVLVDYGGRYVLGIVEYSKIGNPLLLQESLRPEVVDRAEVFNAERHQYMIGYARLLSWVDTLVKKGEVEIPRYPPQPMARVLEASDEVLREVFTRDSSDGWVRLGVLANHTNVPFYVNVQSLVSRHLAILAVTGAGKSNAVAVLVKGIVEELGGTVLIIDMHSEYGEVCSRVNRVRPAVNPAQLTLWEYYRLLRLDPSATKQRLYLRKAYAYVKGLALREADRFLDLLIGEVEYYLEKMEYRVKDGVRSIDRRDRSSIADLLLKLYDLRDRYGGRVLTPTAPVDLESAVRPSHANVIQLGEVDEEVADVITSHYVRRLLDERKAWRASGRGYPVPVLVVIEEAHILVPKGRHTLTKDVVARVAREGRKFGVGLCLVSQRPKNVDEDALSQTNNKVILKLVEPSDKRYVQASSETLSDELLELLPSLNVGEAVVLGMMTPIPALVKVDLAARKGGGSDVRVYEEWAKYGRGGGGKGFYSDLGI